MYIQIEGMQHIGCSYIFESQLVYIRQRIECRFGCVNSKAKILLTQDISISNQSQCRVLFRIPRCFPHLTPALCICFDFPTDSLIEQDNK